MTQPGLKHNRGWREWGLAAVVLIPLAVILARPPIAQDLKYHALVDTRAYFGIPNFFDVASNIPFLLVGLAGLQLCARGTTRGASRAWAVFFIGVTLVFFGSAYYHWNPGNATLVWDRAPMTIAFMGLFAGLVSEHAGPGLERALLAPAVAVGLASVAWWAYTGDLRPYIWVQAAPLLAVLFVLVVYPGRYTHRAYLGCALLAYVLAKSAEFHDGNIYALTSQLMSGHTLKHLTAALSILLLYLMLRWRKIRAEVPASTAAAS
jgi:hypothetical protein